MGKSIIEQVEQEKAQKVQDEARRNELRGKIESWRSRGYVVARLLKAVDGEVAQADRIFSDYDRDVRRLSELQLRLNSMDVMGFPNEVMAIRQRLNDPDAVDDLDRQLGVLEGKIKAKKEDERKRLAEQAKLEKEKRMGWYRQRIATWAEKGYSTKRLDGLLEDPAADSVSIEKELAGLDSDIQKLLELGKRLAEVRGAATAEELKELDLQLFDPEAAGELEAKVEELEQRLFQKKSADEKRQQLKKRLEEYREKGYKVVRLEGAPDGPLENAEALFCSYDADVGALFKLWDRLRALNRSYFPQDWEAARALMNDPDKVAEVERCVSTLEARQVELAAQKVQEGKQLVVNGKALLKEIFDKMRSHVPDYLPQGIFLESARWEPQLSPDGLSVRAETHPGLLSKQTAVVSCELSQAFPPNALMVDAERSRAAGRFMAKCYMMTQPSPEMADLVKGFSHPSLSAYIYDLGTGTLVCNDSDLKTKVYSGWFMKGPNPLGMRDAIKMVADKHGIFTRAVLEQKLGMQRREIDDMLKRWMARNEVISVSKIRDEYSFMD